MNLQAGYKIEIKITLYTRVRTVLDQFNLFSANVNTFVSQGLAQLTVKQSETKKQEVGENLSGSLISKNNRADNQAHYSI